ncbi:hypothetical protein DMA39_22300 [Salmonella enterica subsp. enterica serovar Muenchen]|nr:hypothetical protein [Salmonella enterica subsp. enterica serovar Muenchen]ECR4176467.1 hypothetical protein [Salmonella enterica]EFU9020143.1 hypothetical protein [Salmonella enterica]
MNKNIECPVQGTIYYSRKYDGECYYIEDVTEEDEDGFFLVSVTEWDENCLDEDDMDEFDPYLFSSSLTPKEWENFRVNKGLITRKEITCFDTYWYKKFNG